ALAVAARIPLALTVFALALLVEVFARRTFRSARAGLYAALIILSSFGIFIFTRITIPDAAAGKDDQRGVESGSCATERPAGKDFNQQREGEDGKCERDAGGYRESIRGSCAEKLRGLHATGHRPVEQRGLFEVADAVGVERDVVVAQ